MLRSKVLIVGICSLFCATLVAQPVQTHKSNAPSQFEAYLDYAMQHKELVAATAAVASAIGMAVGALLVRMMASPAAAKANGRVLRVDPVVGVAALMGAGGGIDRDNLQP